MKHWGMGAVYLLLAGLGTAAWGQDAARGDNAENYSWWLLRDSASTIGPEVDYFYYLIFAITGVAFLLVEGALVYFLIRYRRRPGVKPYYIHGHKRTELIWTAVPAAILLALALGQMSAWAKAKQHFPTVNRVDTDKDEKTDTKAPPIVLECVAQQFEWNFRYWYPDNAHDFKDFVDLVVDDEEGTFEVKPMQRRQEALAKKRADLLATGQTEEAGMIRDVSVPSGTFFAPVDRKVLIYLTSTDVIHSLFIPHMRVKQDAVPGMLVKVWFQPDRFFLWDLKTQTRVWVDGEREFDEKFRSKKVAVTNFINSWDRKEKQYVYKPVSAMPDTTIVQDGKILFKQKAEDAEYALGLFDVVCAELCGAQHFTMDTKLQVGTPLMYKAWMAGKHGTGEPKIWKRFEVWRMRNRKSAW